MAKNVKTNAMRILDSNKIDYDTHSYTTDGEHVDGITVAHAIGRDAKQVYKTLVAQGHSKEYYVFVIPVDQNLNLKKAAKAAGEKSVEMIHVKDINKITGYIRGGCSPVGMKKLYGTFVNETAKELDTIIVSAGKIGYQIELKPEDLQKVTNFKYADIIQ